MSGPPKAAPSHLDPGPSAGPSRAAVAALLDDLKLGCGPLDGPYVSGKVQAAPDFTGVVEIVAPDGLLGSGQVARETAASVVLRFGVDISVNPARRQLPSEVRVLLRAGPGGEVLDTRILRLERPADEPPCG